MRQAAIPLFGVLAACAAPAPLPPAPPAGPVDLVVDGQEFGAELQPGPVLTVSRDQGFGNFEGKLAKDVAVAFCASRNRPLDPRAYGRFVAGAWVFDGGCA